MPSACGRLYNMTDIANVQAWIMPIVVAAFGIFAAVMFYYRNKTAGEAFDLPKFLQTLGLGALAALVLYIASAAVPDVDTIISEIAVLAPGGIPSLSAILAALLVIWNGLSKKSVVTPPIAPAAVATAPITTSSAAPVQTWVPGLTVTPTFQKGNSPLPISLTVKVGMESATGKRCKVKVDWMDSTPIEIFTADETTGIAVISHTYTYSQGTTQYTGHSFYPEITALSSDGNTAIQSINVDGKCCEIEVQSVKTA